MANTVWDAVTVELLDGTEVELKPLNIKGLKKFAKMLEAFFDIEDNEEALTALQDMTALCIYRTHPHYSLESLAPKDAKNEEKIAEIRDLQEETFDADTMYFVIEKCTGTKLKADPEEVRRMLEKAASEETKATPGKTS